MAGRFSVCVYNFLDKRTTLGEPQLADKRFVKQGAKDFDSRRQIVAVKNSKCSLIADAPNTLQRYVETEVQPARKQKLNRASSSLPSVHREL